LHQDGSYLLFFGLGSGEPHYELQYTSSSSYTYRYYLEVGTGAVGMVLQNQAGALSTNYFHRDQLGSVTSVTNDSGTVLQKFSYDAWGKRRNPNGTDATGTITSVIDRGYTGHEEMDSVGLVNMNGRIYDPSLGRFTSADHIVADPHFSQDYNRYAYVLDNPLGGTDPSGHIHINNWWSNISGGGGIGAWLLQLSGAGSADSPTTFAPGSGGTNTDGGTCYGSCSGGGGATTTLTVTATYTDGSTETYTQNSDGSWTETSSTPPTNAAAPTGAGSSGISSDSAGNGTSGSAAVNLYPSVDGLQAHDLAILSGCAYGSCNLPTGYTQINPESLGIPASMLNTANGMNASLYQYNPSGQYVLAFQGTQSWSQVGADLTQAAGMNTPIYNDAIDLATTADLATGGAITFTGHSLGGGLASAAALATGANAVTFNSAGLSQGTIDQFNLPAPANGQIYAYSVVGDPLTLVQSLPGIPSAVGNSVWLTPPLSSITGPLSLHSIGTVISSF